MKNIVFMFMAYRISMIFMLGFIGYFQKLKYSKKYTLCVFAISYAISSILDFYNFAYGRNVIIALVITAIEVLIVQSTSIFIGKYGGFRSLFIGITSSAYVLFGNVICYSVYIGTHNVLVSLLVQIIIHIITIGIFIFKLRDDLMIALDEKKLIWKWLCIIPAIFYIIVYSLTIWPSNLYSRPQNIFPAICVLIVMLFEYIMLFNLFVKQNKDNELRNNIEYLENYSDRLKCEADILQKNEREISMMRHDMRHYVAIVQSYINEREYDKAIDLLCEINEKIKDIKHERYCENLSVNGVIEYCSGIAEKNSVKLNVDVHIPQKLNTNEFEFATVICNLLENAVNAASSVTDVDNRNVEIKGHTVKQQIIFQISNTFEKNINIDNNTELPMTIKGAGHGYGLKSVVAYSIKNNGTFDYDIENSKFIVRVLINN